MSETQFNLMKLNNTWTEISFAMFDSPLLLDVYSDFAYVRSTVTPSGFTIDKNCFIIAFRTMDSNNKIYARRFRDKNLAVKCLSYILSRSYEQYHISLEDMEEHFPSEKIASITRKDFENSISDLINANNESFNRLASLNTNDNTGMVNCPFCDGFWVSGERENHRDALCLRVLTKNAQEAIEAYKAGKVTEEPEQQP